MKKLSVSLILTFTCFRTLACSCAPPEKIGNNIYLEYPVIVKGEIKSVRKNGLDQYINVKIISSFNGTNNDSTITIHSPIGGAACGFKFREGEKWLLFAYYYEKDVLTTDLCTRSKNLAGQESITYDVYILKNDLDFLEKGLIKQNNDTVSLLKKCLDLEELQEYFHSRIKPERIPLIIEKNINIPENINLEKFKKKVLILTKQYILLYEIKTAITFEVFYIKGKKANIKFHYPIEGIKVDIKFKNINNKWFIKKKKVTEN